jgi:hypothetical protein
MRKTVNSRVRAKGCGVKTLLAVRESMEQEQWALADQEIARVGKVLKSAGAAIESAAALL